MTTPAKAEREELRACPFCGGSAIKRWCQINCSKCWAIMHDPHGDEKYHVDMWNRRSDPVRDQLLEALESIVAGDIGPDGVCHATFAGSQCVEIAQAALASAAERKAGRG